MKHRTRNALSRNRRPRPYRLRPRPMVIRYCYVYRGALTTAQIMQIEDVLSQRWGIPLDRPPAAGAGVA